jgi:uncharacterized LabA/DUF88 family protein
MDNRIIAYIDGFNLYFGLRASSLKRYYWLNVRTLAQRLIKTNQELVFTKYFTARINGNPEKEKRQSTYIEALETLRGYNDFDIYTGRYQRDPFECPRCKETYLIPHEKMTDVNIATQMLLDAFNNRFDKALLISADADLVPPIRAIREKYPEKGITVAFPPNRYSGDLRKATSGFIYISHSDLSQSRFPVQLKKDDGFILECPEHWKWT